MPHTIIHLPMSFEEVPFKGEDDSRKGDYVPFTPPMVHMITMGARKPPLVPNDDEALGKPHCFEIDGIRLFAFLRLIHEEDEWDIQVPLAMCRYVKPEGEMLFNQQSCEDATTENARRALHNKFVVNIFREFMPVYDCGSSANLMTMPQAPESYVYLRREKIKELKKDKLEYTRKAIEYLAQKANKFCGLDYQWDDAWAKADDACFENTIAERQRSGKVRVRIEGRRPCWWDGKSKRDESGHRVKWVRGESHTFLTPDVRVAADDTEDELMIVDDSSKQVAVAAVGIGAGAAAPGSNPFETLFAKPQPVDGVASARASREPRIELDGEDLRDPPPTPDLERHVSIRGNDEDGNDEDGADGVDLFFPEAPATRPSKVEEFLD